MIIDSFPFFNELELLDLRLNYLNNNVDKFVLVEGTKSHQEKTKNFILTKINHYLKNMKIKLFII